MTQAKSPEFVKGTPQFTLKHLKAYVAMPLHERLVLHSEGRIFLIGGSVEPFGTFKYFEHIDVPLFRFANQAWMGQRVVRREGRAPQPAFRLYLTEMGMPGLFIPKSHEDYRHAEKLMVFMDGEGHDPGFLDSPISTKAMAKLHQRDDCFLVELWEPKYAMEWIYEVNQNFNPPTLEVDSEVYRYPARWEGRKVMWVIGDVTYETNTGGVEGVPQAGMLDVQFNRPKEFFFTDGGSYSFEKMPLILPGKPITKK